MRTVRTFDLETDPFKLGRLPQPFCYGLYDPTRYSTYWGVDCIARFVHDLSKLEPGYVYAHNGGKFDFLFLLKYIDKGSALRIVNGRVLECRIHDHIFRDSFAIMPFKLSRYKKDDIDYAKLEKSVRSKHKPEIAAYLRNDCKYLHELVTTFIDTFGMQLTIGGTAMKEIKKRHEFEKSNQDFDRSIREKYYFGGRNQCFRSGVLNGSWKVHDINSQYPHCMAQFLHPVSTETSVSDRIESNTAFLTVRGHNRGAFCQRTKRGLDFTHERGIFHTSIHEYQAALETGSFHCEEIIETIGFDGRETFDTFVNDFYQMRQSYKRAGDETRGELTKYCLNSGYGKFAQNPENYYEWQVIHEGEKYPYEKCACASECSCKRNNLCTVCDKNFELFDPECVTCEGSGNVWSEHETANEYALWKRPSESHNYYNVAAGSSITGAARSLLLRGLSQCTTPIYCDTDSVISESFSGNVDPSQLGAWKFEGSADVAAIAGKKLYALFSYSEVLDKQGKPTENFLIGKQRAFLVKKACKGANLTGRQILSIAKGRTVHFESPVPQFKISGKHKFVGRNIRRTAFV